LNPDLLDRLRNPPSSVVNIDDSVVQFSIKMYLTTCEASQKIYESTCRHLCDHFGIEMLSYHNVKNLVADLTGIYPIEVDMCINSCIAYAGAFIDNDSCHECHHPRYDPAQSTPEKRVPYRRFCTFPIGPQLQALVRSPEGADVLEWRQTRTKQLMELLSLPDSSLDEYDDILCGDAYLDAVKSGQINDDDFVLMFSADGAQLYKNKASDFWIYIWLVIDHPPDKRYKKRHILPGAIIPGPNKPKNLDSFTFTGLHHLSALQDEGLAIWNARTQAVTLSYPFLFLALADAPGMAALNGLVGTQGQYGCRIYCGQKGRRKTNGKRYYPVRLKPHAAPPGSDHPDLPLNPPAPSREDYERNLIILKSSVSTAQYKENRLATGICKPTIFSGLRRSLGVPGLFGLDIMHLPALNIPDLFLPL
ncbi:hypothetical protein NEOLEDRAFT_1079824, partial [Neolentinus lepideus HHB14362 ss-1]